MEIIIIISQLEAHAESVYYWQWLNSPSRALWWAWQSKPCQICHCWSKDTNVNKGGWEVWPPRGLSRCSGNRRRRFWHATQDCIVPYVDHILHRDRFWAISIASGSVRLWDLRSCCMVLSHVMRGRPRCLLQSSRGRVDRILLAFVLSSMPRAGSGVVRMDPLRFLAGCRTRPSFCFIS